MTFLDSNPSATIPATQYTLNGNGIVTEATEGHFALGGNEMTVQYNGDSKYKPLSSATPINVNIQSSTTSLAVVPPHRLPRGGRNHLGDRHPTVGIPPPEAFLRAA